MQERQCRGFDTSDVNSVTPFSRHQGYEGVSWGVKGEPPPSTLIYILFLVVTFLHGIDVIFRGANITILYVTKDRLLRKPESPVVVCCYRTLQKEGKNPVTLTR